MNTTQEQQAASYKRAIAFLQPHGWVPVGNGRFYKNGKTYDLTAADITQHERIEREGLFIVR